MSCIVHCVCCVVVCVVLRSPVYVVLCCVWVACVVLCSPICVVFVHLFMLCWCCVHLFTLPLPSGDNCSPSIALSSTLQCVANLIKSSFCVFWNQEFARNLANKIVPHFIGRFVMPQHVLTMLHINTVSGIHNVFCCITNVVLVRNVMHHSVNEVTSHNQAK